MPRGNSLGMMHAPPAAGPVIRAERAIEISTIAPAVGSTLRSSTWLRSYLSYFAPLSMLSILSLFSILSIGCITGLVSVGSVASVGSAFSANSIGSLFSVNSVLSVGCYNEYMKVCVDWFDEVGSGRT